MSAAAIIDKARDLGVSLWVEGTTIKAKGPQPAIVQLLPDLRQHKPALLVALSANTGGEIVDTAQDVVRLRLTLKAHQRLFQADLLVPGERYDGLRVMELFEQHLGNGTTVVRMEMV